MKLRTLITIALAALLAVACTESESQTPTAPETTSLAPGGDSGRPGGPRFEFLDLTDEQKAQVEAVMASFADEHEAMRALRQSGASREEMKAAHEELRAKVHAELDKILTDQQRALWAEHQAKYGFRHGGPPTEAQMANRIERRLEHLTTALNLSVEQQAAVKTLLENMMATRPGQDGQRPTPEVREARHAEFESDMQDILTAEQFATFQDLHQDRGRRLGPRGGRGRG